MKIQLIISLLISLCLSVTHGTQGSNNPFEEDSTHERHLPKDTRFMKEDMSKNFIVDDEIFDRIHEKCPLNSLKYNSSTSYIEGKDKNICSGTLINLYKENGQIIGEFLTAKHCLTDKPKSIYQGISSYSYKGNTGQGYLAHFEPYEGCINQKSQSDKALIKAKLQKSNIDEDKLFDTPARVVKDEIKEKTVGTMNHYPFGNITQRVNEGLVHESHSSSKLVSDERKHEISSLPGSSGAGVFNPNGELFGIHSGTDPKSNTGKKVFYSVSDLDGMSDSKKIDTIFSYNKLYTTSLKDCGKFTHCYKFNPD